MPIPYFRHVRDTDDGCGISECLHCRATWEWRGGSGPVRFCMYCGIAFQGEWACRNDGTPRWLYNLQTWVSPDRYDALQSRWWSRYRPADTYWVIEERSFWRRDTGEELLQDWHQEQSLHYHHGLTAHGAFAILQAKRAEALGREQPDEDDDDDFPPQPHWVRYEYRLVRKQHDPKGRF